MTGDVQIGDFFQNLSYYDDYDGGFAPCEPFSGYLNFFHVYYIPFIISVGLIGNLLSCIVFLTTHLRMRSSSYYLAALAVADFTFLAILLLVHCSFNNVIEIYNQKGWCQSFVYLSTVCSTLSVWLVVAFTVERFIAVRYPLQRPQICTIARAKLVISVLCLIALISQIYIFWVAGIVEMADYPICEMLPEYQELMKVINFLDTIVTLIAPVTLIIAMNTMIIRNLLQFRKKFQNGSLEDSLCNSNQESDLHRSQTQIDVSIRRNLSTEQFPKRSSATNSIRKYRLFFQARHLDKQNANYGNKNLLSTRNQQNITKMLLLISSAFILFNLPSYGIRLYVFFVYTIWHKSPPDVLWCLQQFAMLLFYTHFSINFLLYAMCGITFRRCLWQILCNKVTKLKRRVCRFN
ncbi:thyrotropin-releasing hormone receptor-like [Photinus pyralis]|uniref:thyrotropin-releasing hormone receptor-like n=1 Tax=Photinus pyralis TaxID=7054 RepID=UPI0012674C96|nr:thyrotropin-releasing hormone receptor-like [Photinus pyralis]